MKYMIKLMGKKIYTILRSNFLFILTYAEFSVDYDSFSDLQIFHRQTASFKIEFLEFKKYLAQVLQSNFLNKYFYYHQSICILRS